MNPEEFMKQYVTYDIESMEPVAMEWQEEADEYPWGEKKSKEKPFSYDNMLTNVMEHLETVGGVEFAVLKDPELGRWWSKKVKKREEARKLKEAKEKLYATMTAEELKILGIRRI